MHADQPHVVRQGHPRQADVLVGVAHRLGGAAQVVDQVGVGEHDALGRAGRARRILDEGHVLRAHRVRAPGARQVDQVVGQQHALREPFIVRLLPVFFGKYADALEQAPFGVQERRAELRGDAQQLVAMLVADARRHRHGNDAAEDAGPERVDEGFVVREEQQQAIARPGTQALQVMQDAERAFVQLGVAHDAPLLFALVVGDRARGAAVGLQQLAQRGGIHAGRWRLTLPGKPRIVMRMNRVILAYSRLHGQLPAAVRARWRARLSPRTRCA